MLASTSLRRFAAMPVTLLLSTALVVATPHSADAGKKRPSDRVQKAMSVAKRQVGDPYSYGSSGPGSFDCSGLTSYAYGKAGIKLPRSSDAQASRARRVSRGNLRRGDLIFFHSGGNVYHVAIYWGNRKGHRVVLHSPRPGQRVSYSKIWTSSWFAGRVGPKKSASKPKPKLKKSVKTQKRKTPKLKSLKAVRR